MKWVVISIITSLIAIVTGLFVLQDFGTQGTVAPIKKPRIVSIPKSIDSNLAIVVPLDKPTATEIHAHIASTISNLVAQSSTTGYSVWSTEELIYALESGNLDFNKQLAMLWELCKKDTPLAANFLAGFLTDVSNNEYLRARVLDGLALNRQLWAYDLTIEALRSESAVIARAAVRALGEYNKDGTTKILSELAFDYQQDPATALTAAEALGAIGTPEAAKVLISLFEQGVMQKRNSAIEFALEGLGEIEGELAQKYLKDVYVIASDPEIRTLVLEGLVDSVGNTFEITRLAMTDEDPEVRAAAAWGMAYADNLGVPAKELIDWLESDSDPSVRRNLFFALEQAVDFDFREVINLVLDEENPSVKLAGCQLIYRKDDAPHEQIKQALTQLLRDDSLDKNQKKIIDQLLNK